MWYVWASHLPSLTFRECWRTFEVWSSERPQCNDREGNQRASPYPHDIKNKMHFSHLREGRNRIRRMMNESRNLQLEPRNGCISQFIACSEFCKTPTKRWFSQHMVDGIVMIRTHFRAKLTQVYTWYTLKNVKIIYCHAYLRISLTKMNGLWHK